MSKRSKKDARLLAPVQTLTPTRALGLVREKIQVASPMEMALPATVRPPLAARTEQWEALRTTQRKPTKGSVVTTRKRPRHPVQVLEAQVRATRTLPPLRPKLRKRGAH